MNMMLMYIVYPILFFLPLQYLLRSVWLAVHGLSLHHSTRLNEVLNDFIKDNFRNSSNMFAFNSQPLIIFFALLHIRFCTPQLNYEYINPLSQLPAS